ncbi:pitrilysin family metalloprotease Ecym_4076 [Eremothecium cymbalariae DBVPG|uniref:Presequence protease, mitochondrial n=1 Tax=Eremothecium cymbalariae (strain CBS 270.75 / DBVPG 7215 / KCTC 17166 / NRRL Y-17582) TaxID=931890 RepID=G8JT03_ERECY|nr:hypothetical protein Ecym_4076 [Eremothecium cymbalariae DBVPG\
MLRFRRCISQGLDHKRSKKYPIGMVFHGYKINRVQDIPQFSMTAVELNHEQTGARHLHVDRDDGNNVFSIGFKTNPPDKSGVPHILEHTTLCASQKYPVRDPFFKMLNRSLANFMNAMTGHDYTFYPFATTNKKDFANLRDLYLDATLHPLLRHEDFLQEGWRLEHSDVKDPASDIVFKGVVYNEMKGQVSNADYYFWIRHQEAIYPSLHNSGGDPEEITNLKYDDLVAYHRRSYHPSNSKTFTYGNFPLIDTLQRLNEEFCGYGKRLGQGPKELLPLKLTKDVEIHEMCELDPMLPPDKQLRTSVTWICGSPEDTYESFIMRMLGNLLFDGHSSPFYKRLIESGLGYEFSVNTGVESHTSSNFITIGVQGCKNAVEIHKEIQEIFKSILDRPFENEKIEAILHQLELSKKDQKSDFGLQLLYSILPGWVNKTDPFDVMCFDNILKRFRHDWEDKADQLFKDLIYKYVISKPCFKFTMEGNANFSKTLEIKEQKRLQQKLSSLNADDKKVIYERGLQLQKLQNSKQDLSVLPTLTVNNIPRVGDAYPVETNGQQTHRITKTNGITYLRGKRSLNGIIPFELYPYLPLFVESLTNLGTSNEEYSKIEEQMKLHTGGISTSINVNSDPISCLPELQFDFSGWSLNSKTQHIFDLLKRILCDTDFSSNKDKLKVLIRSLASSNTAAVAESGHLYARSFAAAHIDSTKSINETLSGVEQLKFLNRLPEILEDEQMFQKEIIEKLELLKKYIISSDNVKFMVTTDSPEHLRSIENQISSFLRELPQTKLPSLHPVANYPVLKMSDNTQPAIIPFPFQVHYTAQSLAGVPYVHEDGASLQVMANLLTFKYLHREIREKGGAYGGGASYSGMDGLLNFFSYRDPHPVNSMSVFNNAGKYLLNDANLTEKDLDEGKLTIFQKVDAPISARAEGSVAFHYNLTDDMRQKRREQLLDVSLPDIRRVTEKYLVNSNPERRFSVAIGPEIERITKPSEKA